MKRFFIITFLLLSLSVIASTFSLADDQAQPVMVQYTIHIYDVLDVSVWGVDGLTRTVKVRPDGMISFPLAGDIYVLGKTPIEISKILEKALSKDIVQAKVNIIVKEFYKPQVYILGDIENSDSYDLTEPNMLMKLLSQAKLIHPQISAHNVIVIRKGQNLKISLSDANANDSSPQSFPLQDGDVIYISFQETPEAYVLGALDNPGAYSLPEDHHDILSVLAQAKVISKSLLANGITLIRGNKASVISLENTPSDFEIQPGDVFFVDMQPPIPAKLEKLEMVTIAGHVANPGVYNYIHGQTLVDYIHQAGGPNVNGTLDDVRILRNYPDKTEIITVKDIFDPSAKPPQVMPNDIIQIKKRKTNHFTTELMPLIRDFAIFFKVVSD